MFDKATTDDRGDFFWLTVYTYLDHYLIDRAAFYVRLTYRRLVYVIAFSAQDFPYLRTYYLPQNVNSLYA